MPVNNFRNDKKADIAPASVAGVEVVHIPDVPTVVDFKDLGDRSNGYLIGEEGANLLKKVTQNLAPGRYSKKEIRKKLLKIEGMTERQLKRDLPYIPGIVKDQPPDYAVRVFKTEPRVVRPYEVILFNKDDQLHYVFLDKERKKQTGIIEMEEKSISSNSVGMLRMQCLISPGSLFSNTDNNKTVLDELFTFLSERHQLKRKPDYEINAVYRGKERAFGEGGFGKVKAAFNIDTKEWNAIKVQIVRKTKSFFEQEEKNLKTLGMGTGSLVERMKKKLLGSTLQYNLVMDYVDGISLEKFLKYYPNQPVHVLLNIALQVAEKLDEMHKKGYLHEDIKLENIIYDPVSGKISLIDHAFAAELKDDAEYLLVPYPEMETRGFAQERFIYIKIDEQNKKLTYFLILANGQENEVTVDLPESLQGKRIMQKLLENKLSETEGKQILTLIPKEHLYSKKVSNEDIFHGTRAYIAPELNSTVNSYEFSEKTDIYALGVLFNELLGNFAIGKEKHSIFAKDTPIFTTTALQSNNGLQGLCSSMVEKYQGRRPDLAIITEKLAQYRADYLPLSARAHGILRISDYINASKEEREALVAALRSVDKVVLVDHKVQPENMPPEAKAENASFKKELYAHLRRELTVQGVIVDKDVIVSQNTQAVVDQIRATQSQNGDTVVSSIYYFHPEKRKEPAEPINGMEYISVSVDKKHYITNIKHNALKVVDEDLVEVHAKLTNELERFQKDNGVRRGEDKEDKRVNVIKTGKPVKDQKILHRILVLETAIDKIKKYQSVPEKDNNRVTYAKLFHDFQKWEKEVIQKRGARLKFTSERTLSSLHAVKDAISSNVGRRQQQVVNQKNAEYLEGKKAVHFASMRKGRA